MRVAIILVLFCGVALINIRGVSHGVRLSVALTIIKIAPLALLVIGGLFVLDPAKLAWPAAPTLQEPRPEAAIVLFYAFIGVEAALSMSGEIIQPSRTVPRGILLGLIIIVTLYMGLQLVAQGTMGAALAQSKAALVDTANFVFGAWGGRLLVVAVAISASGCLAADMLSSPRVLHAFAQQRQLPRWLAGIHPRFGTPAAAIGTYAALCAALRSVRNVQAAADPVELGRIDVVPDLLPGRVAAARAQGRAGRHAVYDAVRPRRPARCLHYHHLDAVNSFVQGTLVGTGVHYCSGDRLCRARIQARQAMNAAPGGSISGPR